MPTVSIPLKLVSDIVVNTATSGDQVGPVVERLANGTYVVVWTDHSHGVGGAPGDTDGTAVKGQLLDADGNKIGGEFLVNTTTIGDQVAADIVPMFGGGFAVIWASVDGTKIRRFDASGLPTGAEAQFTDVGGVLLAGGGLVRDVGEGDFIVYDSSFAPITGVIDPGAGDDHFQQSGTIIPLSNGDFAFVWGQAFTFMAPTPLPYLVIFNADGTAASGVVSLAGGGIIPLLVTGFALPNDNIVIIAHFPQGSTGVTVLDASGVVLSKVTFEHGVTATSLGDDGFALSWVIGNAPYFQLFDADGSATTPPVNGSLPVDDALTVLAAPDGADQNIHSRYFETVPNDAIEQVNLSLKDLQMSVSATGSSHTATLSVDYGVMFATPGTSGASVFGSGTDTVTIVGTIAQINAVLSTNPTSILDYQANTDDPPEAAILTLSLGTASVSAVIHIVDVNDTGAAVDDAAATDEGTTITIRPLDNDVDPDGASVATVNGVALGIGDSTTLTSGAIVTRTGADTLAYDPNAAFDGLAQGATDHDTFGYTIDGGDSATVTVTINGLAGTSGNDAFNFQDPGDVVVGGGRGDDSFAFRDNLGIGDRVDGGEGNDRVNLFGEFGPSIMVSMGPATIRNVETIGLERGWSYWLTTDDANVAAGDVLSVEWTGSFRSSDRLTFDGSDETDGRFVIDSRHGQAFLLGGAMSDVLIGSEANDTLDGGGGADTMDGGAGPDIFAVDSLGDVVIERVGEGEDRIYASSSYRLPSDAEVELLTAATSNSSVAIDLAGNDFAQTIFGNDGANLIEGLGGNDVLRSLGGNDTIDGGTGGDQMLGGAGDDLYRVDGPGDNIVEAAGEGVDQVVVHGGFRLGLNSEVEFLSALSAPGTGIIDIAGSDTAQTIWGHAGSNSLEGFGGNDVLFGMAGNDTLDGGTGTNTLRGGLGDDTYAVSGFSDFVTEGAGQGNDRILAYGSYGLAVGSEVELLTAANQAGTQALNFTGNGTAQTMIGNEGLNELYGLGAADVLFGLGGNDVLDGGAGADVTRGGTGNDAFAIDDSFDQVIEVAGEGFDRLFTTVDYRIGESQSIELLVADQASGAPLNLAGNNLSNTVIGNGGANLIEGHGAVDRLEGNGGNDTLDGGDGGDILNGGAGADQFRFSSALDGNFDRLEDFVSGTDTIALSRTIFTGLAAGSVPAAAFVLGSTAADADDRLIYNQATGQLFYDADGSGSGAAVLFAALQPGTALAASDFVVI